MWALEDCRMLGFSFAGSRSSSLGFVLALVALVGGGCGKSNVGAGSSAPTPGTIPITKDVLGSWRVVGKDVASTLVLNADGTFSNAPANPADPTLTGTWTLDEGNLKLTMTSAKGKSFTNAASLKWDANGVILMSSKDYMKPLRMSRGDWPKEAFENAKK